jgi:hypothetical protein
MQLDMLIFCAETIVTRNVEIVILILADSDLMFFVSDCIFSYAFIWTQMQL